jgi:WD40 repeat protein
MREQLALGLTLLVGLLGCSTGGVQALAPVDGELAAAEPCGAGKDPSASDYSAHLDLLVLGYDNGCFEVRAPAPQHVLSRGKHGSPIVNVAVSFDGQRLATADREGVLAVSETGSGELKMLPRAASAEVGLVTPIGLAWDHAGKRLAVASGSAVQVIQVDTGIAKQAQLDLDVSAIAFSEDDRQLVVGGNRISFLSLPDLKEVRRLALPTEPGWQAERPHVLDLRYNADGSKLGALLDVGIALFDLSTDRVESALIKDLKAVGLRFATDGKIAVFARHALYVGPASGESVKQGLREINGTLWDLEFRRDDSLLFFGNNVDADLEALLQ